MNLSALWKWSQVPLQNYVYAHGTGSPWKHIIMWVNCRHAVPWIWALHESIAPWIQLYKLRVTQSSLNYGPMSQGLSAPTNNCYAQNNLSRTRLHNQHKQFYSVAIGAPIIFCLAKKFSKQCLLLNSLMKLGPENTEKIKRVASDR